MNTRSRSKKERLTESLGRTEEQISGNVVKRIDFSDLSSPEPKDLVSPGFRQHEVVTTMETIPGLNRQLETRSIIETVSNSNLNKDFSNTITQSTSHQNKLNKDFSEEVSGSNCTTSEANENFTGARQFFYDLEARDRVTSDYYSGSDTPTKLNESTRRLSITKPLNCYIAYSSDEELEDWWDQPKTDYTYCSSLTYRDSVTPERRIGSPNMSRRGLKGVGAGYMASPAFSHVNVSSASDSLSLRSRRIPRRDCGIFSDDSDAEESHVGATSRIDSNKHKSKSASSERSSVRGSRSVFGATTTSTTTSTNVSYGLDVDSDAESDSGQPHFARPVVRKGFTSFLKSYNSQGAASNVDSFTKSASVNSLNGRGDVRMGNHLSSTSTPPSITTTTTTSRFWEKLNGKREHGLSQGQGYQTMEHSQGWKDKLSQWRRHSWTKVRETVLAIYTSLFLWLAYVSEAVRNSIVHRKQKSHGLHETANSIRLTTIITTTTVMSTKQTVVTSLRNLFAKYKSRRKEQPCFWMWLPLLLALLLASFITLYLLRERTETSGVTSLPVPMTESSEKFRSFFSVAASWVYVGICSLSQSAVHIFHFLVSSLFYLVEVFKSLFYTIIDTFQSVSMGILNFLSSWSYSSSSSSPSSDQKVLHSSDSYWAKRYSPVTIWSNGCSSAIHAIKYVSHSSWIYLVDGGSYLSSGLLYLWSGLVWLILSLWYLIASLFSSLWLLLCFGLNAVSSAVSGFTVLLWKPFTWISILAKPKVTSQDTPSKLSHVTLTSLQPTSEELLEQVLGSPRLLDLIVGAMQEKLDGRCISEESLSSTIRLNVEAEANKLRSEIVQQEVLSPNRFSTSKEEIDFLRSQQETMISQLRDMESILSGALSRQEVDRKSAELREHLQQTLVGISANLDKLSQNVVLLQEGHTDLAAKVRSCCDNVSLSMEEVEKRVTVLLSDLIGLNPKQESENILSSRFGIWLGNYFATKEEMRAELNELWEKAQSQARQGLADSTVARSEVMKQTADIVMAAVLEQIKVELKSQQQQLSEQLRLELQNVLESGIDDSVKSETEKRMNYLLQHTIPEVFEQNLNVRLSALNIGTEKEAKQWSAAAVNATVERIVKEALLKYDADKTGMVDHALESGGGSIVSTRCTEGYQGHQAELTLFGYSFYRYSTNTPRSVIQPDRNPGQCYAFKGSQGYIVIQFAGPVQITGFTMEHIPKVLTPSGSIDSAPRDFSVYGLRTIQVTKEEGFYFGDFTYDEDGEPLQYYDADNLIEEYFPYVELRIHSNHGNMQYSCLYRFRVHGMRRP